MFLNVTIKINIQRWVVQLLDTPKRVPRHSHDRPGSAILLDVIGKSLMSWGLWHSSGLSEVF